MKLLLDTHAFLWAITDDAKLSPLARKNFLASDNELFLSVASVWEVITKVQVGKMDLPAPAGIYLKREIVKNNIQILPILMSHVLRLEQLPLHHRDPFDRIMVAQAIEEGVPILTADPLMKNYVAATFW